MAEIRPKGHMVAIEVLEVENKSKGGIITSTGKNAEFEQDACEFGRIVAFGPTAYHGVTGCIPSQYPPSHPHHDMTPPEIWGVAIGDLVEFRRYTGKKTGVKGKERIRYIPDTEIIGGVIGEVEL